MEAQKKRRISLEDDFMDWHKDDIMYAYLLRLAEYRVQDNILYIDKQIYYDCYEDIMEACGYTSRTSLRTNIKKWITCGLIIEDTIKRGKGKEVPVYIIKNHDNIDKKYQLVDLELLKKLSDTKNKHSIQIYTYLLNKYKFNKNYEFTFIELRDALGYSKNRKTHGTNDHIANILQDLQMTGYIDYEIEYKSKNMEDGKIIQTPVKILTKVAETIADLPKSKEVRVGT